MKAAVIGIGSNSVRMMMVEIDGAHARRLMRDRAGTRLFAGLDAERNLSEASMQATAQAVAHMANEARTAGAEQVSLFATSAVRDAANADKLIALLEAADVKLEIVSGEEEAALSFMGVTDGDYCGVIDIGGGSTELVIGQGSELQHAISCQMGAVRLQGRMPIANREDVPRVIDLADSILAAKLTEHPLGEVPAKWIGTGGTFTTLAALLSCAVWNDRGATHGVVITREDAHRWACVLADMTVQERLQLPGLQPHRADIVVHGICILLAVMRRLKIAEVTVSEHGNLDGYLKRRYGLAGEIER